jgi:hypothetical protein
MTQNIVTGEPSQTLLAVVEFFEQAGIKLHLVKQKALTPAQQAEREALILMLKEKGFTFKEEEEV